jgi:hypothetical protein
LVPRRMQGCRRARFMSRTEEGWSNAGREQWRDGRAVRSDLWLDGREDGISLYARGGSGAVGEAGYGEAEEMKREGDRTERMRKWTLEKIPIADQAAILI